MVPAEVIAGRFEIEEVAGAGGMGTVYRARDRENGAKVAVKLLQEGSAAARERFGREATVLADLRHPGIVQYVAHGATADGALYLAMEWLDGEDLAQRLERQGLTLAETMTLLRRTAEALAFAHRRGIVHRDIKPGNVFLPRGVIEDSKLVDFGIARVLRSAKQLTRANAMIGTPGYMAPEQARAGQVVDARADVFALGCVGYECITGRPAYVGDHVMAIVAKMLLEPAPRVSAIRPDVPAPIDELLARMMAKRVADRPADGSALGEELESLAGLAPDLDIGFRVTVEPPQPSLTSHEQRLLCVIFAGMVQDWSGTAPDDKFANTLRTEDEDRAEPRLREVAARFGAQLERISDRSFVVTVFGAGAATDQAARAARCALAMRAIVTDLPMALATGRADVSDRWPVGEVVDRGVRLVASAAARNRRGIVLDDASAGLLTDGFVVSGDEAGLELTAERDPGAARRTLLGRAVPCVGREREIGTLVALFDECVDAASPRAALVTAEAGIGKSRVRFEVLERIRQRGVPHEVIFARGDPMSAGAPFGLLAPALARVFGVLANEPIATRQEKVRARVGRNLPERDRDRVVAFLGELVSTPFSDEMHPPLRAARADPTLMGDQVRRAWEDWIAAEARVAPIVLVLEDLHWGDLPSVHFIESAMRVLEDQPIYVLALARPEVQDLFPNLWSGRLAAQIHLTALSRKASEKLARLALGDGAPSEAIDRAVTQAGGNAFYLEEILRALATGPRTELPETVMAMVQARLESLEPETRRVLRAASVFGQSFWEGGVRALVGTHRTSQYGILLEELVRIEIVAQRAQSRFAGQVEYGFRHALVRDAAYAMLTDTDRRLGHKLAAEWLERNGEPDAMTIAEHYERAGETSRAARGYWRAAEQALEASDLAAVITRAERAIAAGASGTERAALRVLQCEAHTLRLEHDLALALAIDAIAHAPAGSPLWCDAIARATNSASRAGLHDRADAFSVDLRAQLEQRPCASVVIGAGARAASGFFAAGRASAGAHVLTAVHEAVKSAPNVETIHRAWIHRADSWHTLYERDLVLSLEHEVAAGEEFARAGDVRSQSTSLAGTGFSWMLVGLYDEAENALRNALVWTRRLGMNMQTASSLQNLGFVLARRGAPLDECVALEHESLEILGDHPDPRFVAGCREYLAIIYLERGLPELAEGEATLAIDVSGEFPGTRALALAARARARIARADFDGGVRDAREARDIMTAVGQLDEGTVFIRLAYAESLAAAGEREQASAAYAEAKAELLAYAEKIRNPTWRAAFLEKIPENAQTLTQAAQWPAT